MVPQAYSISVIVSGDVNYTDPATSARIDSLIESLENSTYINQHLSKSWLHDFRTVTRAQVNRTCTNISLTNKWCYCLMTLYICLYYWHY